MNPEVLHVISSASALLGVDTDGHRAVIDERHVHHCAKSPVFDPVSIIRCPDTLHKLLILLLRLRVHAPAMCVMAQQMLPKYRRHA